MIRKLNTASFALPLFFLLFIFGALQMFFYFFYIYAPLERLAGKNLGVPEDLPTVSSIFNPGVVVDESVSLKEQEKLFYPNNIEKFKETINGFSSTSEFIKTADTSYVLAGRVHLFEEKSDYYSLTLRSGFGKSLTINFPKEDIKDTEVTFISFFPTLSKTKVPVTTISPGDYIILRKTISLLDKEGNNKFEIELHRNSR